MQVDAHVTHPPTQPAQHPPQRRLEAFLEQQRHDVQALARLKRERLPASSCCSPRPPAFQLCFSTPARPPPCLLVRSVGGGVTRGAWRLTPAYSEGFAGARAPAT